MTSMGHTLTGATIGVLCKPAGVSKKWTRVYFGIFVLLSLVPDLPFKNWSHDRYGISHSIFVNLLLIVLVIIPLSFLRDKIGGWRVIVGGSITWLSHLLLDSFYNHGRGVAIFWPFSKARLALPMPWFSAVPEPGFTSQRLEEYLIEFVFYFPLLLLAIGLRNGICQRLFRRFVPSNGSSL
jgi:membrane-bound metal-dependent hydrolase YbcI (DUF457 family)